MSDVPIKPKWPKTLYGNELAPACEWIYFARSIGSYELGYD